MLFCSTWRSSKTSGWISSSLLSKLTFTFTFSQPFIGQHFGSSINRSTPRFVRFLIISKAERLLLNSLTYSINDGGRNFPQNFDSLDVCWIMWATGELSELLIPQVALHCHFKEQEFERFGLKSSRISRNFLNLLRYFPGWKLFNGNSWEIF